jgi:exodeoxyribonuclease VII large subunit
MQRLLLAMTALRRDRQGRLVSLAGRLEALSPLRTLERGYAIVLADKDGRVVVAGDQLEPGDRLRLRFARGNARVRVEEVER